ncbi:MAG: hypothetical protein JRJ42_10175 [Deltaproteobacteria bacterium]|nr:hypothetical protein [Deltaproteobacteria bacterium]MBW2020967.1 hypothetical protein [Deltaproteobacteria bacterium]MBW2075607.1 hypothetical protein [Deltaproteobacteria bacterium]
MSKILFNLVIGFILAAMTIQSAMAQSGASFIKEGTLDGVRYLSGGVGLEERAAMKDMVKDYNLKLVFAISSGKYLSNLMVVIKDARGKLLLDMKSNGPWFLVKVPEGQYMITVAHGEQKKVRRIEVGKGIQTVMFLWKP